MDSQLLHPNYPPSPCFDPVRRFSNPQFEPEFWPPPADVFRVDDLFDFPNDDDVGSPLFGDDGFSQFTSATEIATFSTQAWNEKNCARAAPAVASMVLPEVGQPSGELCVPPDELANQLEWLSSFVEDSSYSADTMITPLVSSGNDVSKTPDAFGSPVSVLEQGGSFSGKLDCSTPSFFVPSRARRKRSKTGGRVWSLDTLIPTLVDNRLGAGDPVFIDCSGDSEVCSSSQPGADMLPRPSKKKKFSVANKSMEASQPRRCTHCLVQKTPQWRAGPMGPKTLCNACGVRYKSGRLLPEYRPAASPTFLNDVHSNSHKRVLEMRRQRENEGERNCDKPGEDDGSDEDNSLARREDGISENFDSSSDSDVTELNLEDHEEDRHSRYEPSEERNKRQKITRNEASELAMREEDDFPGFSQSLSVDSSREG